MPTKLLSTQAPASIINMRPLTREQFLQGVREGISGDVTASGGVTTSSPTVKTYWIDGQNNRIGLSSGWNLWVMQFIGVLIALIFFGIFWLVFNNLLRAVVLATFFGATAYGAILIGAQKRALLQQYYLLDEYGIPKRFMSSIKPNSIRNVPPITREQFLQRVAAGATRILA
jgi:hypothetical protein